MAPVESDFFNSNRAPLFYIISSAVLVDLCLVTVIKHAKFALAALPPSQKTRARNEQRKQRVATFGSLAVASLLTLIYHWGYSLLASYEAWAHQEGEATPGALWDGWYAGDDDPNWQLGRWWADVDPPNDFKRASLGTSRGLWWTQQLLFARIAFSAFLGIEGRRRDVPNWAIAALWGLSEFASLSLAQSLFFVTLIITPVPSTRTHHGARWTPKVFIYLLAVATSSLCVEFLPGLASNNLGWAAELGCRLTALFLATGIRFLPHGLGSQHKDVHAAHQANSVVYRVISLASVIFFVRRTFWGALLNSGETYHRRYNFVWNMHPTYERPLRSKLASALTNVLGAISDDPAISVIGWDVLLSGFSLCVWAAVRGLDVSEMVNSIVPWPAKEDPEKHVAFELETESPVKEETPTSTSELSSSPAGKRGRGRPKKNPAPAQTPRRSLRRRAGTQESDTDDISYAPPADTAAEVADLEHEEEHDDTVAEDAEAAALAWGLSLAGGLGLMSAAVMGAEVRSR